MDSANNKDNLVRSMNGAQRPTAPKTGMTGHKAGKKRMIMKAVMAVVAVAILTGGILFAADRMQTGNGTVDKNAYQAVFLTNGQVYFGKLKSTSGDYLELTNIYYLQVQQDVQPADSSKTAAANQTQLVKLGNELHGPQDQMQISSKQVLFWENLKTDGKVSQAISTYKP